MWGKLSQARVLPIILTVYGAMGGEGGEGNGGGGGGGGQPPKRHVRNEVVELTQLMPISA